jgi:hypothetical protein
VPPQRRAPNRLEPPGRLAAADASRELDRRVVVAAGVGHVTRLDTLDNAPPPLLARDGSPLSSLLASLLGRGGSPLAPLREYGDGKSCES